MPLGSHLSRPTVADGLKPPPESGRASLARTRRSAPDPGCSPTVLLRIEFTAADCLQPPGELLPRLSTLTSSLPQGLRRVAAPLLSGTNPLCRASCRFWNVFIRDKADYFCCTSPEVAFGGRYPLSMPFGARTFLVSGLSAISRGCLAYSWQHFTL